METITRKLVLKGLSKDSRFFVYQKDTEECATITITERRDGEMYIPSGEDIGGYVMALDDHSSLTMSLHSAVIPDKIKETIDTLNSIRSNLKNMTLMNLADGLDNVDANIGQCISRLQGLYDDSFYKDGNKSKINIQGFPDTK